MAAALNVLFDKRRLALTRAKLRAWWEGEEFDEEGATAAIEAELAEKAEKAEKAEAEGADDELFDAPAYELPPRLAALALIWGEGRVRPGDAAVDGMAPGRETGYVDVAAWREETIEALKHSVKTAKLEERVSVARIDLEAHVFTPASYDGLYSVDDFAYSGHPPFLAQQIMKCLKPGACAVAEAYVGLRSDALATAFASSFAEPQIRAHGDVLQVFRDTGFVIEADEDLTNEFLDMARNSFKQLGEKLSAAAGLEPATARELAWEAEAWRMRLKLLVQRRLERRRFVLRRPAEGAPPAPPDA